MLHHDPASDQQTPRAPQNSVEWEDYFDLRWRILRAPWDQPRGSEKDDREETSQHLMIAGPDAKPIAVGRLHFNSASEAQVRFMAVAPEFQGRGLGGAILEEFETRARRAGASSIVLNARDDAQRFYARHGFVVTGPAETIFSAVKHVRMRKTLQPPGAPRV